jgi:hypothetical protein
VVDADGRVVRDAHVELSPAESAADAIAHQGISVDDRGEALFVNLPPGRYRVRMSPFFPWHMDAPEIVQVDAREDASLTLQVRPAPRIRGRVLDVHGRPAPDVDVLGIEAGRTGHATRRGRTDHRGEFALIVGTGPYRLVAAAGTHGDLSMFVGEATAESGATGVVIQLKPYTPPRSDRGK